MNPKSTAQATVLMVLASGATLFAQTPPSTQMPPSSTQTTPQRDENETVTASGCLKQAKDVASLSQSLAERAGVDEDFVLTSARLTSAGSVGMAQMPMYRITGLDNDQVRPLLNQQVEVTGRLGAPPLSRDTTPPVVEPVQPEEPAIPPPKGTQPPRAEVLQEIRAASIRAIASSCRSGTW
jgi:hypothetical protein